jgi:transcriptional regulator with AAA-type ATPase domain
MERAVTLARTDTIEVEDLPALVGGTYAAAVVPALARNETLRAWSSRYVRLVFERCRGSKRDACQTLGISYHTLQTYLKVPLGDIASGDGAADAPAEGTPERSPAELTA